MAVEEGLDGKKARQGATADPGPLSLRQTAGAALPPDHRLPRPRHSRRYSSTLAPTSICFGLSLLFHVSWSFRDSYHQRLAKITTTSVKN